LYSEYFSDYRLNWVQGIKLSNKSRASGGQLYGIRASIPLDRVNFNSICNQTTICIKNENINVYVLSVYLNCSHWEQDYNNICDFLHEFPGSYSTQSSFSKINTKKC